MRLPIAKIRSGQMDGSIGGLILPSLFHEGAIIAAAAAPSSFPDRILEDCGDQNPPIEELRLL